MWYKKKYVLGILDQIQTLSCDKIVILRKNLIDFFQMFSYEKSDAFAWHMFFTCAPILRIQMDTALQKFIVTLCDIFSDRTKPDNNTLAVLVLHWPNKVLNWVCSQRADQVVHEIINTACTFILSSALAFLTSKQRWR